MAGPDQNTHRIDAGRNPSEPPQPVSEAAGGETEKSVTVQGEQAKSGAAKSRLATETKMGMAVVVILVVAFGFLVFHKFDLKQRGLLQASIENSSERPLPPAAGSDQQNPFGEFYPNKADDVAAQPGLSPNMAVLDESSPLPSRPTTAHRTNGDAPAELKPTNTAPAFFDMDEPPAQPDFNSQELAAIDRSSEAQPAPPAEEFFARLETENAAQTQQQQEFQRSPLADSVTVAATSNDSTPQFDDDPFAGAGPPPTDRKPMPLFPDEEGPETRSAGLTADADSPRSVPPETSFPTFGDESAEPVSRESVTLPDNAVTLPSADSRRVSAASGTAVASFPPQPVPDDFSAAEPPAELVTVPAFNDPDDGVPLTVTESEDFSIGGELSIPSESAVAPAPVDTTLIAMLEPSPDVEMLEDSNNQQGDTAGTKQASPEPEENFDFPGPFPATADSGAAATATPEIRPFRRVENAYNADPPEPFRIPQTEAQAFDPGHANPRTPSPVRTTGFPDSTEPRFGMAQMTQSGQVLQTAAVSEECEICEVRPNENYWTISKRVYGTPRYFSSLALFNSHRVADPKKLRPGMKVLIPDPQLLEQKYPEFFKDSQREPKQPAGFLLAADGSPAYRVGADETLSQISSRHLGRASRWMEIYRMNQHILKDPHKLKEGTVLALPEDATDVHLAP